MSNADWAHSVTALYIKNDNKWSQKLCESCFVTKIYICYTLMMLSWIMRSVCILITVCIFGNQRLWTWWLPSTTQVSGARLSTFLADLGDYILM